MSVPTTTTTPEIEIIGGAVPSDELLELLAEWLLDAVESEGDDE
jgi:hypothetical protein